MQIVVGDPRLLRMLNVHAVMVERYGADLADRVSRRMAVLGAARDLAAIPPTPPFGLRRIETDPDTYTVDLGSTAKLLLRAHSHRHQATAADIKEIEVIAIRENVARTARGVSRPGPSAP